MDNVQILESIRNLVATRAEVDSLLAAIVDLLHRERPSYNWVGVYLIEENDLVLNQFVGEPTVHTRIPLSQGICGAAASTGQTLVVDDINSDPRYLACGLETRSGIVVPIWNQSRVLGEIDIDSDQPAAFTSQDRELLEAVAALIAQKL